MGNKRIEIQKSLERVKFIKNFTTNFRRWCVLTNNCLSTFEKDNDYTSPTEVIDISKVKTIKSDEKDPTVFVNKFKIKYKTI